MASPQPTDAHGIIAHSIQENILIRDFSKQQLKIIYLVIRLSWGCSGNKAWQYTSYKDFEVIGLYKSDVAKNLRYLHNNKVIRWEEKYNLLIFNKDYDQWTIPKKVDIKAIDKLIHESLKNTNEVRNTLTVLVKNTNGVSEKLERLKPNTPRNTRGSEVPKESIKESNIYTHDFEKFYSLYPRAEEKQRTFKNWKTCLKNHKPETLIQAGANYKDKVTQEKTEKQFIKKSANFLGRDKFYQDYIRREASDASKYADVKM